MYQRFQRGLDVDTYTSSQRMRRLHPLILRCNGQDYRLRMSRELIEESLTSSL